MDVQQIKSAFAELPQPDRCTVDDALKLSFACV